MHRRKWTIVLLWLIALLSAVSVSKSTGSNFVSSFELPNTESAQVREVLAQAFPSQRGDTSQIVFESKEKLTDSEIRVEIENLIDEVSTNPIVESIESPYDLRTKCCANMR
jgi:putative drug exporter of the RND superfamily